MNTNVLQESLGVYLPVSVGLVAQVTFLLLPVHLRNWRDDLVNVFTYVAFQMFVGAIIFVIVPRIFEFAPLGMRYLLALQAFVVFASLIRAQRIIPLEGTSPVLGTAPRPASVQFTEFYDRERMVQLAFLSENDPDDLARIARIKERVRRRGKNDSRTPMVMLRPGGS